MKDKDIILLTGTSGAGKTTVSNLFEDLGYYCLDQYPSALIDHLMNYLDVEADLRFNKLLLVTNLFDFEKIYLQLQNCDCHLTIILLDANKESLLKRYRFTRRIHPLLLSNKADSLEMAISIEKEKLKDIYRESMFLIDTSNTNHHDLKNVLETFINTDIKHPTINFESFGFKYGQAENADVIFDVRVLDNPFYVPELKELTGLNKEVYDFVCDKNETKQYLLKTIAYLEDYFELYHRQNRRHLTISIGCTGGKHRSVSVALQLYQHFKDQYNCFIRHRDIDKL